MVVKKNNMIEGHEEWDKGGIRFKMLRSLNVACIAA